MPATPWTEQSVEATAYMSAIPAPSPMVIGGTVTEDYFCHWLMEYGEVFTPFFPPELPGAWTKQSVAATAQTEMTVAATAWTELT